MVTSFKGCAVTLRSRVSPRFALLEIVDNELRKKRPTLLHEFQVLGMILVFILSLFALELDVQRHLIGLINDIAMASCHSSDVEIHNARN